MVLADVATKCYEISITNDELIFILLRCVVVVVGM